jgi:anti-sigma factor RsiW
MRDTRERPVCHRAEDLVTYLYGEATAKDALDFRDHLQQCDACRSEFAVFNQVHDSIHLWRDEALGASFNPVAIAEPPIESNLPIRPARRLSALAALRDFFTVAPLWLRGATAFAALSLCALSVLMFARVSQKPVVVVTTNGDKIYSRQELQDEIKKAVDQTRAEVLAQQNSPNPVTSTQPERQTVTRQTQLAVNQPRTVRPHGLNRQEREQLAADLRLTLPADDDEWLMAMPEQENPNR